MKRLLKKKVKIFKREISVFLIVLVGAIGLASAALIPYFAQITGLVTVEQSILFDGKDINDGPTITEEMNGVAGDIFQEEDHALENNANTWILVDLSSTKVGPTGDVEGDGINTYPEYKLMPTDDGVWNENIGDEDDVHFYFEPIIWSEFESVSFNYNIIEGPSSRIPHVNAWLRNDEGEEVQITTWNGGNPNPNVIDGTATYNRNKFVKIDGSIIGAEYNNWEIREVRIQSGNPGADPSLEEDLQVVYVTNVEVNNEAIGNIIELPTQDYANVPGKVVEFRMVYDFAYNAYPGTYRTITTVEYAGIIDESGVTITDNNPSSSSSGGGGSSSSSSGGG